MVPAAHALLVVTGLATCGLLTADCVSSGTAVVGPPFAEMHDVLLNRTVPATQPLQVPLLWMVCPAPHAAAHLPVLGPVVISLVLLMQ